MSLMRSLRPPDRGCKRELRQNVSPLWLDRRVNGWDFSNALMRGRTVIP